MNDASLVLADRPALIGMGRGFFHWDFSCIGVAPARVDSFLDDAAAGVSAGGDHAGGAGHELVRAQAA